MFNNALTGRSGINLVPNNALDKLSTVNNVFRAQVIEKMARQVFKFPATTWEHLLEINRLLSPPGTNLSKEDRQKGATIVSCIFSFHSKKQISTLHNKYIEFVHLSKKSKDVKLEKCNTQHVLSY